MGRQRWWAMEPGFDEQEAGGGASGNRLPGVSGAQMHDEECLRMAAFRLRETAKQLAMLAGRAQDPVLRNTLLAIHKQLLNQEGELRATKL